MADGLGRRVLDLRRRKGKSQADLAPAAHITPAYLSLVEQGKRRPGAAVVRALAEQLGTTVEYLTTGRSEGGSSGLEFDLRFAEVALRSGDPATARDRFAAAKAQAAALGHAYDAERWEALFGLCRANEALGELEVAGRGLEELAAIDELPSTVHRAAVRMWLCRVYMQTGDLGRAIDLGERTLAEMDGARGHFVSEEVTELASTLVFCYFERGDLTRAQMLVESTVTGAEAGGSLRARAAAYWNGALVAEARGEYRLAQRMLESALALYGEVGHAFAVAALRANTGTLYLRLPTPRLEEAASYLRQALQDLPSVGSPADVATAEGELARCYLMRGEIDQAIVLARTAVGRTAGGPNLVQARARAVLATALFAAGEVDAAVDAYTEAAAALEAEGARRQAAPVWQELAMVLVEMGRKDEAITALLRVANAAGVPAVPSLPAAVRPRA